MAPYNFKIGADPEFACLDGNQQLIRAEDFLQTDNRCNSDFGADGAGVLFEVRPTPSTEPLEVVTNIHKIFAKTVKRNTNYFNYDWIAGSYHSVRSYNSTSTSIGGHIHFGTKDIPGFSMYDAISILDEYLGSLSLLIENKADGLSRRRSYGYKGDHRSQTYGFEYRVLSSWLSSPYVSASILCLAKTIVYELINNRNFNFRATTFSDDDFRNMNVSKVRTHFDYIWSDIVKMMLYQKYKPYIDIIYYLIKNQKNWFPSIKMKEAWGIYKISDPTKITMDTLWHRYLHFNKKHI